jgi:hypothetical protein
MQSQAKFYEYFAKDCVRAAKRTDDPKDSEMLLKMAREWMMEAAAREASMQSTPPEKTRHLRRPSAYRRAKVARPNIEVPP